MREFTEDTLVSTDMWSGKTHRIEGVTTLILSIYRTAITSLYDELAGAGITAQRIGDGLAPRKLQAIIYEAERAARDL